MSQQPGSMYPNPSSAAQNWRTNAEQSRHDCGWLASDSGLSSLFSGRMLLGMAAVALGVTMAVKFGPDLVRYMKIRDM